MEDLLHEPFPEKNILKKNNFSKFSVYIQYSNEIRNYSRQDIFNLILYFKKYSNFF